MSQHVTQRRTRTKMCMSTETYTSTHTYTYKYPLSAITSQICAYVGIVQGKAQVRKIHEKESFRSFEIEFPGNAIQGVQIGASVAINGTCLTVVEQRDGMACFDVIEETLRKTNLGNLKVNSNVNFERSARVGDEIGGHTVSGHVQTVGEIKSIERTEDNVRMEFMMKDVSWMKYVLPKGFIAVDGCSLTVGEVTETGFCVYLIPETLRYVW